MAPPVEVVIRYRRPRRADVVFRQQLVEETPDCVVTFHPSTPLDDPMSVGTKVVLEPGSPVVWFTFPGRWHDIGAFHLPDGTFTGLYANILTPVEFGLRTEETWEWSTTDLFLDVWLGEGAGAPRVLDREEFERARDDLPEGVAAAAEGELRDLLRSARNGTWPPVVIDEWPLSRVRKTR